MSLPKVSIIIPVYNSERFLAETIESALNQTYPNIEVIVVDDGSWDSSLKISQQYESIKLKVHSQANSGASAARNKGFELSTGEFIQYLDSDDILAKDKIENQIKVLLAESEPAIASCPWGKFKSHVDEANFKSQKVWADYKPIDWLVDSWTDGGMMQTACWLTPRSIIIKAGNWDEALSLHDDGEFFTRVLLMSCKIKFCNDSLVYYRTGLDTSLSQTKNNKAIESAFKVSTSFESHLLLNEDSLRTRKACIQHYVNFIKMFYPARKELMNIVLLRLNDLGLRKKDIGGGNYLKILTYLLGFRAALVVSSFIKRLLFSFKVA